VHDLAKLTPDPPLVGRPGRFVFTPDSKPDDAQGGLWCVEAAGADSLLRTVLFAPGETGDGLDVAAPVVEGVPVVIRHRAAWGFPAVIEVQRSRKGTQAGVGSAPAILARARSARRHARQTGRRPARTSSGENRWGVGVAGRRRPQSTATR
jgi:hypothetical protein